MAEASDTFGILKQNLIDAGCDDDLINNCMELASTNEWESILSLLYKKKGDLLHSLHREQKYIDCLDFLVHKINKEHI